MITFREERYLILCYVSSTIFASFSYNSTILIMYLQRKSNKRYCFLIKYEQKMFNKEKMDGAVKVKCFADILLSGVLL